jgi:DNA invertase Pin-like site-specific DNA recombinase/diadenosine tetraphosphatase ApaH/serine/threonine PP2A family protein phosphatase
MRLLLTSTANEFEDDTQPMSRQATVPVVIYAAKSTPDPKDSTGSQVERVRERVAQVGDRFEYEKPFAEDNKSGWSGSRGPKLDAAIAAAAAAYEEHGVAELWVFHSSRLGRGDGFGPTAARSLNEVVTACNRAGVTVRSVEDDEFVSNQMLVGIASTQANKYSADISSHVKRGKQRQLEQGQRLGGPVPDGYLLRVVRDEHDRVTARDYLFDPEREPTIRRMHALSLEGHGAPAVSRVLNAEGHRRKNGKLWDRRAVQHLLKNPFFAGVVYQHGEMTRGIYTRYPEPKIVGTAEWPAMISLEDWRRIQDGMKTRDSAAGSHVPEGQRTRRYVLARLGICDRCGERMYTQTYSYVRKDGTMKRQYVCSNIRARTGLCDQPPLDATKVDAAIVEHLSKLFIDFDAWLEQLAQGQRGQRDRLEADLAQALDAQNKLAKQEDRLRARYIAATETGGVAETAAFEAYQHVITEREAHQGAIRELQEALAAEPVEPPTDSMLDVYNDLAHAVRGSDDSSVGELNDRLRAVFAEFRMDEVEPGVVGVLPVLRPDVVDRYADRLPLLAGPNGDKAGDLLPPTSPAAIFAGDPPDDELSARVQNTWERWQVEPDAVPDAEVIQGAAAAVRAALGPGALEELGGLPTSAVVGDTLFVHASPVSDIEAFSVDADPESDDQLLSGVAQKRVVFGHSHVQFARRSASGVALVNAGSVGLPWDGDARAAYATLDDAGALELHRVEYDVERAASAVEALGAPWATATAERLRLARF